MHVYAGLDCGIHNWLWNNFVKKFTLFLFCNLDLTASECDVTLEYLGSKQNLIKNENEIRKVIWYCLELEVVFTQIQLEKKKKKIFKLNQGSSLPTKEGKNKQNGIIAIEKLQNLFKF